MNNKKVEDLLLKDDILFNVVFRDDEQLSKEFISILESCSINDKFKLYMQESLNHNLNKKSVLDMKMLSKGKCCVVEMQQQEIGFPPERTNLIVSTVYANIVNPGTRYEDYPLLSLHVICAYNPFSNGKYKSVVQRYVEGNFKKKFEDKVVIYYHDITSSKLPNNLYGDLCKYINTGKLSNHSFIVKLDNKIKLIKNREETKMELHEALGTICKYEYVAEEKGRIEGKKEGKKEGKHEILCNMIIKLKDKGYSKEESCTFMKDTVPVPKKDIIKAIDNIYK